MIAGGRFTCCRKSTPIFTPSEHVKILQGDSIDYKSIQGMIRSPLDAILVPETEQAEV